MTNERDATGHLAPWRPTGAPLRRCLVTGGAGFIGSHLVDHLLARGDAVTVIDNLSTGRAENLSAASAAHGARLRFLRQDLGAGLDSLGPREAFDQIYHLAAAVGVRRVIERPIECIETNVLETAAVLRFAVAHRERGAPLPATLIASSSEVYGKSAKSPFAEDDDCVYGPTTAPRWSYAASKAIDEYLALAHHAQSDLPVVVGRFFNTVGPRQIGDYGMVLPGFVGAVLAGRRPQVYGDGAQTRCFCDVRDAAPALPRLLETPACRGRVFNLGSDRPISILELARLTARTLGSTLEPELIPYDRAYAPGFEDLRQRRPDLARIQEAIGFTPTIELTRTILDLAAWLRAQPLDPAAPARSLSSQPGRPAAPTHA